MACSYRLHHTIYERLDQHGVTVERGREADGGATIRYPVTLVRNGRVMLGFLTGEECRQLADLLDLPGADRALGSLTTLSDQQRLA